jgi:outer membrane protein assembly factor BamB
MVFVGDLGRVFHCVDTETGQPLWSHPTKGQIWSTALVADGKVYVGNRRGEFYVFAASREKKLMTRVDLEGSIFATPVAANGVLYVATLGRLFALQQTDR